MMFVCKACGYKYNMVVNLESNKCILCRSVSSSIFIDESKVLELTNPYDNRKGPVSLESK